MRVLAGKLWLEAAGGRAAEDAGALQGETKQVCDHEQEAANWEGRCEYEFAQVCLPDLGHLCSTMWKPKKSVYACKHCLNVTCKRLYGDLRWNWIVLFDNNIWYFISSRFFFALFCFFVPTMFYSFISLFVFEVKTGEDGMQGQEHAGPSTPGSLHHRTPRSFLHWAVDRWICLPESHQVRTQMGTSVHLNCYLFFFFFYSAYRNAYARLSLHVVGSKSESTLSGRTLRGRGSCWGRGNLPPWPKRFHPTWSTTNEKAEATAKRVKRTVTRSRSLYCVINGGLISL